MLGELHSATYGMSNARSSSTLQVRILRVLSASSTGYHLLIIFLLPLLESSQVTCSRAVADMLYIACTVPHAHTHC
jgi:hypothetical protein